MGSISDTPAALPATKTSKIAPACHLVEPLSRRGTGPGIILLVTESGITRTGQLRIENGVPSAPMKWAEEGYCVVEIVDEAFLHEQLPFQLAVEALAQCEKCKPKERIGIVSHYNYESWNHVASRLSSITSLAGVVLYTSATNLPDLLECPVPIAIHAAGKSASPLSRTFGNMTYDYATTSSGLFATPFHPKFSYADEAVSHTRSLTFLKKVMNGPYFDLEAIWDEHTAFEFADRSVEKTMATMVQEPYVNHVPTLTGGIGREALTEFYREHFIFSNPEDTELELISRTVGIDRVIDEFIFKFTHDRKVDWLFPGVEATGRKVEVPMMAVVCIRGDRLYHEHISWDQASALAQIGLLPSHPSYERTTANGSQNGTTLQHLPIAGVAAAQKMRDKNSLPSNSMIDQH